MKADLMQDRPDLVRREVDEGHIVGSHTWTHPNIGEIPNAEVDVELTATQRLFETITGKSMRLFRPPFFGDAEPSTPREVLPLLPKHDAVITSPPYNTLDPTAKPSGLHAERKTGINKWMDKSDGYFDQIDEEEYQRQQQEMLMLFLNVAPVVWINHKTRYRDGFGIHPLMFYKAPLFAEVVWDRGGSMALNCGRFAPSHEYWFAFGKPEKWNNENNKMLSVWRIPPGIEKGSDNDHQIGRAHV